MDAENLDRQTSRTFKNVVINRCGSLAGLAVSEIFEDAFFHGINHCCRLIDENDHIVVVVDNDCPKDNHRDSKLTPDESIVSKLCLKGIVVYYYHSIYKKHHHVCLALKKHNLL